MAHLKKVVEVFPFEAMAGKISADKYHYKEMEKNQNNNRKQNKRRSNCNRKKIRYR